MEQNENTYNDNENRMNGRSEGRSTNGFSRFLIPLIILALIASFFAGQAWATRQYSLMDNKGFDLLQTTYERIHQKYLYELDDEKLIDGAIAGMVSSLGDTYSQFLPNEQGAEYAQSYQSNFYGIGAEIREENGRFFVSSLVKDMPAEKAGIKPEDEIVQVDRQPIEGMDFNELLSKVRGKKGTSVIIGVQRAGAADVLQFEIQRAEIPVNTVSSERLANDIGLISISGFKEKTDAEFSEALEKLQGEGELKGLIIDLRSNPGGLLEQTVNIASMLIPKGEKVVDVVYKDNSKRISYVSRGGEAFTAPIVVLINEYSASASEVLSAALKETVGAQIVGVTSYGKGVVQSYERFRDSSVLVLTEAEWKTPLDNSIHKIGVEPNYVVKLPEYASLHAIPSDVELKLGSYGDNVELLVQYLQTLGYSVPSEGVFDKELETVLRQYETAKGLPVDGVYTAQDGTAMIEDIRALLKENDTQLNKAIELLHQG